MGLKARVKGTTDIIEVEFDKDALNEGYPPYYDKEHDMYYQPEQLEWVDNDANADPDYWARLEHTYAGMAMQAYIIASHISQFSFYEGDMKDCKSMAHALVEKMKEERK